MSLITPDFGLLFWMVIIFAVLLFLLAKFGFPVITGMVDKRSERIENSLEQARQAEEQIVQLKAKQDEMVRQARLEQGRIMEEAQAARDNIIADARQKAVREAAQIVENGRKKIAEEREDAMRDLRTQVAAVSINIAEKLVRHELKEDPAQQDLIRTMSEEAEREISGRVGEETDNE